MVGVVVRGSLMTVIAFRLVAVNTFPRFYPMVPRVFGQTQRWMRKSW